MAPTTEANGENRFTRQLKPASKPATLRVSEAVENAALIDAGAAGRARDGQGL